MKTVSIEPFIIRSFKKIRFLYAKCYVGCVWSLRRWFVEAASDGILRIWSRVQGFCQVLFFSKRKTSRRSQYVALLKQFFCFIFFPYNKFFLHLMMMTFWLFMRLNPCIARSHSLPSPSHSSTTQQRHVMYTKGRFFLLDGSVFCTRHIHSERDKQKISVEMMMICVVKSVWGR